MHSTPLLLLPILPLTLAYPSFLSASGPNPASNSVLSPRQDVDYSNWQPAGRNDARSPCPALNSLANHGFIPHSGRGLTYSQVKDAFASAINVGPSIATALFRGAQLLKLGNSDGTLDLDKIGTHNKIEHDGSLSRMDTALGDGMSFDQSVFDTYLAGLDVDADGMVGPEQTGKARMARVLDAKSQNSEFTYGLAQMFGSNGETALFTCVLGDKETGEVKAKYMKVFFEEERLPYIEGWRPSASTISLNDINKMIVKIMVASGEGLPDAKTVTLSTLEQAMKGLAGHFSYA